MIYARRGFPFSQNQLRVLEDEDEEDEEDLQDPDFDAMIEEGVKAGQLRVKVQINSSG